MQKYTFPNYPLGFLTHFFKLYPRSRPPQAHGRRKNSAVNPRNRLSPPDDNSSPAMIKPPKPRKRFRGFCKTIPSINKGRHGFDGQKCAHTASSPLKIRQVFSAGLFLSGHISAPTKLLAPASDLFLSDFWLLRCRRADARQGEKGKKRRKDTLSGVFALVDRWYVISRNPIHPSCRKRYQTSRHSKRPAE